MARKSERVGRGPCPYCGSRVSFHRTAGGLLNFECDAEGCGGSGYAHKGEAREAAWMASMERSAAPAPMPPESASAPAPAPEPEPPKTRRASVFELGQL